MAIFASRFDAGGVDLEARSAHQSIRKSLDQADQALAEAERETLWGRRSDTPEGLVRSLRRLAGDGVMIGRALASPLPRASGERIGPSAMALLQAIAIRLRNSAGALEGFRSTPPDSLDQARAAFETAVEQTRAARLTAEINFDAASRVFGLVFAMESLLANLSDLADRIAEVAGQAAPSAGAGVAGLDAAEP